LSEEKIMNRPTPTSVQVIDALIGFITVGLYFLARGFYSKITLGYFSLFHTPEVKKQSLSLAHKVRDFIQEKIEQQDRVMSPAQTH
jgi:hypothetical protein